MKENYNKKDLENSLKLLGEYLVKNYDKILVADYDDQPINWVNIYVMLQVDELPYFRIHEGGCVNENDMYIGMEEK